MTIVDMPPYWARLLDDVTVEHLGQLAKWGEQNHPDGTGPTWPTVAVGQYFTAQARDMAQRICKAAAAHGHATWHMILAEEFHEATAEEDPAALRAELIQVAAVALNWVAAIDRRTA